MWSDIWPLAAMLGLYGVLYLISVGLHALGFHPTMGRRPGIPFVPHAHTGSATGASAVGFRSASVESGSSVGLSRLKIYMGPPLGERGEPPHAKPSSPLLLGASNLSDI